MMILMVLTIPSGAPNLICVPYAESTPVGRPQGGFAMMKLRRLAAVSAVAVAFGLAGSAAQATGYDLTSIVNYNSTGTLPSLSGPSGPLVLVNNEYGNSYSAFTNGV